MIQKKQLTMSGADELSERLKYGFLSGFALLMGGMAFLFNSPREIYEGNLTILASPANLLTDYMALTNVGSALSLIHI